MRSNPRALALHRAGLKNPGKKKLGGRSGPYRVLTLFLKILNHAPLPSMRHDSSDSTGELGRRNELAFSWLPHCGLSPQLGSQVNSSQASKLQVQNFTINLYGF